MSDNWVVQNLENTLGTWNEKLAEIWTLLTQSPEKFKGGEIWKVILNIHGALQAIAIALLVLFFLVGVVKTCGTVAELKKPEHAVKLFIRFAIAKGVVTYGLELMLAIFSIVQGVIETIMRSAGVCLEGAIIMLACIIFSKFASSPPEIDADATVVSMVWAYIGELVFNMLVLVGTVKMADRLVHEMMGI